MEITSEWKEMMKDCGGCWAKDSLFGQDPQESYGNSQGIPCDGILTIGIVCWNGHSAS
jgi:hypothetical protein